MAPAFTTLIAVLVAVLLVIASVAIIVPVFKGIGWIINRSLRFVGATVVDIFRLIGVTITGIFYLPFVLFSVILGRWSRAQHYGRAFTAECQAGLACLYRLVIGHPARLIGAESMVEGIEKRLPQAVAAAPPGTAAELRRGAAEAGGAVSSARAGQFPGYTVIGTLQGGGSGGKLYIARPDATKMSAFARQGFGPVGDVVIKSFSMGEGSALPQIVRENRALEAARRLGLVLEHELTNERFFYVMRYVPGDSLGVLTPRLHAMGGGAGLPNRELAASLGYACDLLGTLHEYHKSGLWHKDVKPDNIIVAAGHAHLVDFGLVTPLRSSMTLTTHGTEYFRDPEMVRLALRGVKVHEVDGAKFDLYAAGAVIFSMIENSFPAHGGLSQITRTCPEALRWIVRRAMTDYDKRYASAQAMLADLAVVHQAALRGDATSIRPADLPSVKAGEGVESLAAALNAPDGALPHAPPPPPVGRWHGAPSLSPTQAAAASYAPQPVDFAAGVGGFAGAARGARTPNLPRRSAKDQLASARARVAEMQRRASTRMNRTARAPRKANFGVAFASLFVVMAVAAGLTGLLSLSSQTPIHLGEIENDDGNITRIVMDNGVIRFDSTEGDVFASPNMTSLPEAPEPPKAPKPAASVKSGKKSKASRAATQPAPEPALSGVGVTVLVMQEPSGYDDAGREQIRSVLTRLQDRGFTVISNDALPADEAQAKAAEARYIDMAVGLRKQMGLHELQSPEAISAVGEWLKSHAEIHSVVWITPDRDSPTPRVRNLIYTSATAPAAATKALDSAIRGPRA